MLRPLPRQPSPSLTGLADELEPEDELETRVAPRSSVAPLSVRSGPASVRSGPPSVRSGPPSVRSVPPTPSMRSGPLSVRSLPPVSVAPVQVQDFAFADTVIVGELAAEEAAPASGPIFVNDPGGDPQCLTPLAFPVPEPIPSADLASRLRAFSARTRNTMRGTLLEMREAWDATAETAFDPMSGMSPPSPLGFFARRVVALWTSWQWDRADVVRAAIIGTAVFAIAAALGASAVAGDPASGASEVREGRTLDQHTGRAVVVHAKR